MGDEPTEAELIDIANSFLLSAPPGEFMEVVTDIRALLPRQDLLNNTAAKTFRAYNTEQMLQVDSPGKDHKVLISKYGEVGDGEYLDPRGQQVVQYDHIKNAVTGSRAVGAGEGDASVESTRSAIDDEAQTYVSAYYPHGTATTYGKDGKVYVCISSARFNPNNFWNGRWRSVWTVDGGNLTGHFKIHVHYYEDGNVQLNTDTTVKASAAAGDAKAIFKAILAAEQKFQEALGSSYNTMGDTTFKALRRALPITRTKIDWNKIKNYKIGLNN
jgi:F-actin-capping protein subunit alpha